MHYFCLSFTHKNTPIEIREQISLSDEVRKYQIQKLVCANENILECLVLSTCNRVEILCYAKTLSGLSDYIINSICIVTKLQAQILQDKPDVYEDIGCVHHVFSVASSLDSLVVGETQIVSQLKDALKYSVKEKYANINLVRLVQSALKCAASVRNQTTISKNPVSVSSVAVAKAKELLDFNGLSAVVVGAGLMSELACKHLISSGVKVIIVSRTKQKADELANSLGVMASSSGIENLKDLINSHSLIFSATSSSNAIIDDSMIENRDFKRYFFDIAIPRDINLTNSMMIKVFSVDDLEEIVKKNLALREEQANIAYRLINESVREFYNFLGILSSNPLIKKIYQDADSCLNIEYDKAIKKGYLKNSDKDEAYKFADQFKRAFLHSVAVKLKKLSAHNDADCIIRAVRYIFDIDENTNVDEKLFEVLQDMDYIYKD